MAGWLGHALSLARRLAMAERQWERTNIGDASFGPDTLNIIHPAFDDAWDSIAGNYWR
jgi:hypothetical protein